MRQFKCTKHKCSGKINVGLTTCPRCGKTYGVFGNHRSDSLVQKYCENGYQGQSPSEAKVIFIARDANFAENIPEYIFNILLEYLDDGVKFWENSDHKKYWDSNPNSEPIRKVHHPFLLPAYRKLSKRDGYTYHHNFSRLGLKSQYARFISFVEIIAVPTTGYPGNDPQGKLSSLIRDSREHIDSIERDILSGGNKVILISDAAMHALGEFDDLSEFYEAIYNKRNQSSKGMPELHSVGNVTIHKCYHFSDPKAKTKDHTDALRKMIGEYCGP